MRTAPLLLALAVLAVLAAGGCTAGADPLVTLVRVLPADLAEDGVLLQRGAAGHEALAASLDIPAEAITATATAEVPALRVLLVDDGGGGAEVGGEELAAALTGQGFRAVPAPSGWTILQRPVDLPGFPGVEGVAIGPGIVAAGGIDQLAGLAAARGPLQVPESALEGAQVALVHGPVAAVPPLPALDAAVVSAAPGGEGQVALRLAGAGAQADAVALSVLLRTDAPAVEVGGALTAADVVTVDVTWLEDAAPVLRRGVAGSPLGVLGG